MKARIKKQWYGRQKSVEELHSDCKFWLSEIDFIKDEINFLEHLFGLNYIDFLEAGFEEKVEKLIKKIKEEKNAVNKMYPLIQDHNNILADLMESKSAENNPTYLESHLKLEKLMDLYFEKFKSIKKEIFKVVEEITKRKEMKKLV